MKNILLSICYVLLCLHIPIDSISQEYRSFNGIGNNIENPDWGASSGDIIRYAPAAYIDGVSSPAAPERTNPRTISNKMFDQKDNVVSSHNYSDFVWVFGQLIDHELTLIHTDANQPYPIPVPACDSLFDPNCDGLGMIPLNRSTPKTYNEDEVRQYVNEVTAFVDGSAIYGSDKDRATWLRTFNNGKMKISSGNLMPFNTKSGNFNDNIDLEAPPMDNKNRYTTKVFVSGDVRANENINLTVMHTLFLREHNRLCNELNELHPEWSDETLYQEARKRNIAKLQAILYYEWLPTIGIDLGDYQGYDPNVKPGIFLEFSAAAYRMGHTLVNSRILRIDDQCKAMGGGDIELMDAFFNPRLLDSENAIEPFIKGMSYQAQQEMDCQLRTDIRNFLFGPPEAGIGMDLAAINIQRAREEGLPDFNTIRVAFGLEPFTSFKQICPDPNVYITLEELYGTVDNIDPWVGMLAEEHYEDAMFGKTILRILQLQFEVLRNGDRFYFENDPSFSNAEIEELKTTTLRDIIMKNTSLKLMQQNVFKANPVCLFSNVDLSSKDLNMYAFPNPTADYYNLGIYAHEEKKVNYYIVNAAGSVVSTQVLFLNKGMNTYSMNLESDLTPGLYTLVVEYGTHQETIKMQKI